MPIGEQTYRRVALEETDEAREPFDGWLVRNPTGSFDDNDATSYLAFLLKDQLDRTVFRGRINNGRLRCSPRDYFVPDTFILPTELMRPLLVRPHDLEVHDAPMPLVAEVREPPVGDDDAFRKLPGYQRRGDREIWWLNPYERTLTVWRRQPDGGYAKTTRTGGIARPTSLPNVAIDLDALFAG